MLRYKEAAINSINKEICKIFRRDKIIQICLINKIAGAPIRKSNSNEMIVLILAILAVYIFLYP